MDKGMISGLYAIKDIALTEAAQRGRIVNTIKKAEKKAE
jgi:hypothetical protein